MDNKSEFNENKYLLTYRVCEFNDFHYIDSKD